MGYGLSAILLASIAIGPWFPRTAHAEEPTLWVGHQVVHGARNIQFLGDITTKAESFLLARITRSEGGIEIRQQPCAVDIAETAGTKVHMSQEATKRLPEAIIKFARKDTHALKAQPWSVRWGEEDVDEDGNPGLTIRVDSPVCDGDVYVASETISIANGMLQGNTLRGKIRVRVKQKILGASSYCLQVASQNTDEQQSGSFIYKPIPEGTTCASLAGKTWPVQAEP